MSNRLFHQDNAEVFDVAGLERLALEVIDRSSLINRCLAGELLAARSYFIGHWPFVDEFPQAIDMKVSKLPLGPLYAKYDRHVVRRVVIANNRTLEALSSQENKAVSDAFDVSLIEMKGEELDHAQHWIADARNLGVSKEELERAIAVDGIKALIRCAYVDDIAEFFANLTAVELMAEGLGKRMSPRPSSFTQLFTRGRHIWGEVHVEAHGDEPSHLEMDLDLARAYSHDDSIPLVREMIEKTIHLFGTAANEVERHYCPPQRAMAAE